MAGPVIIEENNVLLNREYEGTEADEIWMFPGGAVDGAHETFEETAKRECKEELGIDIEILRPLITVLHKLIDEDGHVLLIHFLAKRIGEIKPGEETLEWGWFDIHNLPEKTAPNVQEVIHAYLNENNNTI